MPSRPILIVEDDPDMRDMLALMLQLGGATVVTAANGVEAYNMARTHLPCLIILDLMMPVMSGEEFRRAQLANETIRKIPVVVVSAHYDARQIARRMRAKKCFSKPVELDRLGEYARRWCR
jgi:CheY-like chemotaxis protein